MPYPSQLTPERHAAIIAAKRRGASESEAARAAGISSRTLYEWRTSSDPRYAAFQADYAAALLDVRVGVGDEEEAA